MLAISSVYLHVLEKWKQSVDYRYMMQSAQKRGQCLGEEIKYQGKKLQRQTH